MQTLEIIDEMNIFPKALITDILAGYILPYKAQMNEVVDQLNLVNKMCSTVLTKCAPYCDIPNRLHVYEHNSKKRKRRSILPRVVKNMNDVMFTQAFRQQIFYDTFTGHPDMPQELSAEWKYLYNRRQRIKNIVKSRNMPLPLLGF